MLKRWTKWWGRSQKATASVPANFSSADFNASPTKGALHTEPEPGLHARQSLEDCFTKAFFASPIPMLIERQADFSIIEANHEFLRLSKLSREEVLGKTCEGLGWHCSDARRQEFYQQALSQNSVREFELAVERAGVSSVLLLASEKLTFQGEPALLLTLQDITGRKEADDRFARTFYSSPVPMAIMRLSDLTYVEANQEFLQLTRLTREQFNGKTDVQAGFEVEPTARERFFASILSQDSIRNYELKVRYRQRELTLLISSEKIVFQGEACLLGSFQDITYRTESEARFAKVFHANPIAMTLIRVHDQRIIEVNESTLRLTGIPRDEMLGQTVTELELHIAPQNWRELLDRLTTAGSLKDFEVRVTYPTGEHVVLACAETLVFNGENCILWSQQDITERKLAEERFAKAFQASPQPMAISRLRDHRIIEVNDCMVQLAGLPRSEILGRTRAELGIPLDALAKLAIYTQVQTAGSIKDYELPVTLKTGPHTLLFSADTITLNDESCLLWSVQDITARKQAEELFSKAFHFTPHPMTLFTLHDQKYVRVNAAWEELTGHQLLQAAGRTLEELNHWVNESQRREFIRQLEETGRVRDFEAEWLTFDGQSKHYLISAETIYFNGQPHVLSLGNDITARKLTEAALRESERRLTLALEAAKMGVYTFDVPTQQVYWSPECHRIFGLAEFHGTLAEVQSQLYPDDRERVLKMATQALAAHTPLEVEFRIVRPDGTVRWINDRGRATYDAAGKPLRQIGVVQDITERKLAEERFTKAFHANPIPMSIVRASDLVILEINRAFLQLAGWERSEVLGRTFAEIGFNVEDSFREELYQELAAGAAVHNREVRIQFKQSLHILLSSAEPLTLNGEACILWSNQDVTELKAAEERFTKAFHANPIPMALLRTSDRRVFEVNRRFEQISGLPRSVVIGKSVDEAGVQIDPRQRDAFNHQLLTTGSARDFEFEVAYPNNVRTVLASAELITLGGEPCVLLSQQDITERKTAEERFTKAFNANPNPMALLALPSTEYVQVNDAWLALAGYDRAEAVGRCANEFNDWVDLEQRDEFYHLLIEQGYVRDFEAYVHPPGQRERLFQISGEIVEINGQPHLLSCSIDITERKQAELALQASEERFRTLAATSQAAISILNDDRFLYANQAAEELYGYTSAELAQLCPWNMVHPDSAATVAGLRDALRQEQPAPWRDEVKIITKSGELRWIEAAVGFVELEGQRCYLVTSFDITNRKETREALRLSEERFATAFNSSPEAMSLSTFNEDRLVLVNDACLRLWGLAREATLGRSLSKLNLWVDPKQGELAYQTVRETGALHNFEAQVYLANGEIGYLLVSAEVVELGAERFVLSVSKNITERKRAEAAIQASETRFRTLTESSPMAILIFDDQRFYYANPAATEMFGYTQAEFAHLSLQHVLDAESWLSIGQTQAMRRWYGESVSQRHEVIITTKSGQKRWIDYSSTSIELDGQPRYILTAIDITKRKRAEAAIQASEIRFRTLAESSQAAILIFDDKQYLYANPAASDLFGYSPREFHHLQWRDLLHPDYYALVAERQAAYERGLQVPQRDEALIITKSGEQRWIDYSLGIAEMDGKQRFIVTALDITQRRQMEAALQASETRFRTLTESSQAAIVIYDQERMIYANPAAERLFGYSLAEITQKKVLDLVHSDSLQYVSSLLATNAQGDMAARRNEFKIVRKDGQAGWIDSASALIEIEGKSLRIVTSFDITERKQAEDALRLSEERFALTFDACPDAMALTTYEGGQYVMVNQAWLNLFGLHKDQITAQTFVETEIWGNREQRRYVYQIVRERGAFRNFEVKAKQPNGETVYLLVSAEVVRLGTAQFVLAVSKDITERKRVEAALLASEAKFRTLAETSQAATLIYDEDRFIYANPAAEHLLGYSQVEIMALTIWEVLHPDAHARVQELRAALQSGENINLTEELQILTKSSESRWINAAVASIQISGKSYRLVTAFDVTERRQAEEDLRVSQEQLRNLAARLQEVREEERAAISREIHDELGQSLTGMKMDLKWLEKQLPADTPNAQQRLASLYELINSTIQNVRKLASSLRPGILDDFGLVAALEWLVQDFAKRTGISCRLLELPEDFPLDRERATAVFRICQEALTNIARHAQATEFAVRLAHAGDALCLEVRDNGKGITADQINHIRSLGLVGMRERALLLGGSFNIHGAPELGSTVVVEIPLTVPIGESHD